MVVVEVNGYTIEPGANLKGANLQVDRTTVQADEHTVWPEGSAADLKRKSALLKREAEKKAEEQKKRGATKAKTDARYQKQKKLASKEGEANARYLRSSDAVDNRDGASSPGDPSSGPNQSELCPSCGVRVRADGSCLC